MQQACGLHTESQEQRIHWTCSTVQSPKQMSAAGETSQIRYSKQTHTPRSLQYVDGKLDMKVWAAASGNV